MFISKPSGPKNRSKYEDQNYIPLPVSQVIVVSMKDMWGQLNSNYRTPDGGFRLERMDIWEAQDNFAVSMHLNGTTRTFPSFFSGITKFLSYLGTADEMLWISHNSWCTRPSVHIRNALGACMATESSTGGKSHKIHPFPPELHSGPAALPKILLPGEWTLFVATETPNRVLWETSTPALRYAFLSAEKDGRGIIKEDIEGFLSRSDVEPLVKQQVLAQ